MHKCIFGGVLRCESSLKGCGKCKMAAFEGESAKVIDKFNGVNFSLWKFKMEMVLASMDLWEIVDGSEKAPAADGDAKAIKEYQRREKKAKNKERECANKAQDGIGTEMPTPPTHQGIRERRP